MHPMVQLCDEAQVVARFSPFGDDVILCKTGARFAPNVPLAQKSFMTHPMERQGDVRYEPARVNPDLSMREGG